MLCWGSIFFPYRGWTSLTRKWVFTVRGVLWSCPSHDIFGHTHALVKMGIATVEVAGTLSPDKVTLSKPQTRYHNHQV